LEDTDCILHLAAISNDPSAELQPELTEEINFKTTLMLADAARARRIPFVFSSSCSVYGDAPGELDENGPVNPLTVYAISKVKAERSLMEMADSQWRPVILRNGTLFGYSPRMRFDLVVNIFSLYSILHRQIKIFGGGVQWRPFLHVSDCARAFLFFAEKPDPAEHVCYNVAHENLRVLDLAAIFDDLCPGLDVTTVPSPDLDARDYRVDNSRLRREGFCTRTDVRAGAEQIMEAIVTGLIPDPESVFYRNAKWLKELTQIGSRDHLQLVELMEHFSPARRP
jgi:nucleoside-diphosphate-sugar epimerase